MQSAVAEMQCRAEEIRGEQGSKALSKRRKAHRATGYARPKKRRGTGHPERKTSRRRNSAEAESRERAVGKLPPAGRLQKGQPSGGDERAEERDGEGNAKCQGVPTSVCHVAVQTGGAVCPTGMQAAKKRPSAKANWNMCKIAARRRKPSEHGPGPPVLASPVPKASNVCKIC